MDWDGWGGMAGIAVFTILWTVVDAVSRWITGTAFWWTPSLAALLTAPISWLIARSIWSKMTPEQRQGDTLLMLHHVAYIPFRIHPYLYLMLGSGLGWYGVVHRGS